MLHVEMGGQKISLLSLLPKMRNFFNNIWFLLLPLLVHLLAFSGVVSGWVGAIEKLAVEQLDTDHGEN